MGKSRSSRSSRSSGTEPQTGDMGIPEDRSTITEQVPENPGTSTTLQQDEEVLEGKMADLFIESMEAEYELKNLGAELHKAEDKIQKIQRNMELYAQTPQWTEAGADDLRYQLRLANEEYGRVRQLYDDQLKKINDLNMEIQALETGFDTGSSSWMNNENDHEL